MTLIQHLIQYFCCRRQVIVTISIWILCLLGHKTLHTKGPFNISAEPCTLGHTNPLMEPYMKQNFCAQRQHSSGLSLEHGPIFNKDGSLFWSHCNTGFCHIAWIKWLWDLGASSGEGKHSGSFQVCLQNVTDEIFFLWWSAFWQASQKDSVIVQ